MLMLLRLVIVAATLGTGITVIAQEPERREPSEDQLPGVSTGASARPRVDKNEAKPPSRLSLVIQADLFEDGRNIEDKIKNFVLPKIEPTGSKARVEVLRNSHGITSRSSCGMITDTLLWDQHQGGPYERVYTGHRTDDEAAVRLAERE